MIPVALLQDRAGAGPNKSTSSQFISNKGERTLFHCVLLSVGHETRDKVSYLKW